MSMRPSTANGRSASGRTVSIARPFTAIPAQRSVEQTPVDKRSQPSADSTRAADPSNPSGVADAPSLWGKPDKFFADGEEKMKSRDALRSSVISSSIPLVQEAPRPPQLRFRSPPRVFGRAEALLRNSDLFSHAPAKMNRSHAMSDEEKQKQGVNSEVAARPLPHVNGADPLAAGRSSLWSLLSKPTPREKEKEKAVYLFPDEGSAKAIERGTSGVSSAVSASRRSYQEDEGKHEKTSPQLLFAQDEELRKKEHEAKDAEIERRVNAALSSGTISDRKTILSAAVGRSLLKTAIKFIEEKALEEPEVLAGISHRFEDQKSRLEAEAASFVVKQRERHAQHVAQLEEQHANRMKGLKLSLVDVQPQVREKLQALKELRESLVAQEKQRNAALEQRRTLAQSITETEAARDRLQAEIESMKREASMQTPRGAATISLSLQSDGDERWVAQLEKENTDLESQLQLLEKPAEDLMGILEALQSDNAELQAAVAEATMEWNRLSDRSTLPFAVQD